MSVQRLLNDEPDSKGWANLYVNTLAAYNGLTVSGGDLSLPPKKKTSLQFQAVNPPEADPIDVVFHEVAGQVIAEVERFEHTHSSAVVYHFEPVAGDAAAYDALKPGANILDYPIHVNDNGTPKVGVLRVGSGGTIQIGSGYIGGGGTLATFAIGTSGPVQSCSVSWISGQVE